MLAAPYNPQMSGQGDRRSREERGTGKGNSLPWDSRLEYGAMVASKVQPLLAPSLTSSSLP
jgi:hypothetical protein